MGANQFYLFPIKKFIFQTSSYVGSVNIKPYHENRVFYWYETNGNRGRIA